MILLYLGGLGLVIAAVVFGLGYLQLQSSARAAEKAAHLLRTADIAALAAEATSVLTAQLDGPLPEDLDAAATRLDTLVRSPRVKEAFAKPELYWRFVLPLGAALGELLVKYGQAKWSDEDNGLVLRVQLPNGQEAAVSPFDRVLRHRLSGRPGQLRAYLLFAAGRPVDPGLAAPVPPETRSIDV